MIWRVQEKSLVFLIVRPSIVDVTVNLQYQNLLPHLRQRVSHQAREDFAEEAKIGSILRNHPEQNRWQEDKKTHWHRLPKKCYLVAWYHLFLSNGFKRFILTSCHREKDIFWDRPVTPSGRPRMRRLRRTWNSNWLLSPLRTHRSRLLADTAKLDHSSSSSSHGIYITQK